MNSDNQLLVGVVMMFLGGFVALLAFTILREQQKIAKDKPEDGTKDEREARKPFSLQRVIDWFRQVDQDQESLEADEPAKPIDDTQQDLTDATPAGDQIVSDVERINVMTLLRDDTTGDLIVQVGDHEYRAPTDLYDSPDWIRVRDSATDLATWLSRVETPETDVGKKTSVDLTSGPLSMVDQINQILKAKLYEAKEKRTIKLHEGPDGTVRVRIEANSYAIDEVPDPEASRLIREAVAEWEALH